ncbi:acyltransferase family protein [Novosphingobium sp.]|uniref:acyltransferase family protein n=1 Tax=Novosphingobium sp. TaxID=1874826 RepID=UPI0026096DEF|nr:acyltransferase family protein [Novosphingobium sp.]
MTSSTQYRRDIDGLRALAILPVLAFHAKLPGFSGGFVGVDIFFVISGFLITGIIAREIDSDAFSLGRFYERRARRILPALLVMMSVCLGLAAWLYLPADFEAVPRSALMTLAFLANVWFFTQTGYFGGPAEAMPLLHCWSLAVEEQFYVVFPALLWLLAKAPANKRLAAVAAIACASFAIAVWKQADTDGFAFYLLPARAWELMAGSLLALLPGVPSAKPARIAGPASLAGLALIVWAVATFDRATVFPGANALIPVLGAVLLIRFAPGTLVGRLLSTQPLVFVGLISYSLYLWHWPLIVFAEYASDAPLSGPRQAAVVLASFLVAWASWRFVERPFRSSARFDQRRIFILSGAGMGALGAVSLGLLPLGGWPSRFPESVTRMADAVNDISPVRGKCIIAEAGADNKACNLGAAVAPTALLWGDSHGVELAWALGQSLAPQNRALAQRTRASCPPLVGYATETDPDCARHNLRTLDHVIASPQIRTVYLAAFWASPTYGQPGTLALLDDTIRRLQAAGKAVTLIGPVPPQPFDVPRHLAHAAARNALDTAKGAPLADYRRETDWITAHYARWLQQRVTIIDPVKALAEGQNSRLLVDGKPAYFDSHHLTLAGASAVIAAHSRHD